ncbi:hypothetical protein C9374_000836 [Naegleria lovaniensis]|uniref:Uncharacterized protein n=1 Tax=Naegleria lovaniensis TaxID=51637 RepID=A0AA88KNV0_NAELO|nr:uncharacterized protein C9374_000836 [Naegleria lovaniensis]KAG2387986.1 hypothetical protein C9374_000836 [Naegleria lovaniensis]
MIPQQPSSSQQQKKKSLSSSRSSQASVRTTTSDRLSAPSSSSSAQLYTEAESSSSNTNVSKKRSFQDFNDEPPTRGQIIRPSAATQQSRTRSRIQLTQEEQQEVEKIKHLIQKNDHAALAEYHKKFLRGEISGVVVLESKLAYYIRLVRYLSAQQREIKERKKRKEEASEDEVDIIYKFNTEGSLKIPPYAMKHQSACASFGVKMLEQGQSFLIAHQMGLGKTLTTLITLYNYNRTDSIKNNGVTLSYLVLVPKSNLMHFKEEYDNHFFNQDEPFISNIYVIASKEDEAKIAEYSTTGGMIIMTHNRCARVLGDEEKQGHANILKKHTKILIIDEAHVIKNPDSEKFKLFSQIDTKRRILMTGTPFQNNMNEIFTLVKFIDPNNTNIRWIQLYFKEQFVDKIKNEPHSKYSQMRINLFNHYFNKCIHRKVEAQELDDIESKKSDIIIEYKLSKTEQRIYDEIKRLAKLYSKSFFASYFYERLCLDCVAYICDKEVRTIAQARIEARLADIDEDDEDDANNNENLFCNDVKKFVTSFKKPLEQTRLKVLRALVNEIIRTKQQVVIFTGLICYEKDIMAYLRKDNPIVNIDTFSGKLKIEERKQVLRRFRSGEINTLLVSKNSGGFGIDLTNANNVILYQLDFNYYKDDQCICRLLRKGQNNDVRVFRMVCENSIDQRLLELQTNKQIIFNNLLDKKYTDPSTLGKGVIDPTLCTQVFNRTTLPTSIKNLVTRFQSFKPVKSSTAKFSREEFQRHLKEFEDTYKLSANQN